MADININAVFPSAKFIVTDSKGDLQEVVGQEATSSNATLQGIKIESVAKGAEQNGITFSITEGSGSTDALTITDDDITLALEQSASTYFLNQVNPAVRASTSLDGIKIDAVDDGSAGNGITFEITDGNGSADAISATSDKITLALDKDASDYKLNEYSIDDRANAGHTGIPVGAFIYFIDDATFDMKNQSTNANESKTFTAGESHEVVSKDGTQRPIITLSGTDYAFLVTDYKVKWGERLEKISTLIANAGTDVTDLATITITGSDGSNLTGTGSVTTSGGRNEADSIKNILDGAGSEITDVVSFTITGANSDPLTGEGTATLDFAVSDSDGELQSDKSYLLISTDDIADYDGVAEEVDGRKMFYGLLETATANISALSDKPQSLVVNRGNIILVNESKMRRSYNITATLDILDTDLASES